MTRLATVLAGCGLFLTVFGFTVFGFAMGADPLRADAREMATYLSSLSVFIGLGLMTLSSLKNKEPEPVRVRLKR